MSQTSPGGALPKPLHAAVHAVVAGRDLTEHEARAAMDAILEGHAGDVELSAFLVALRMKGETAEELAGFARSMRAHAISLPPDLAGDAPLLDTCGTGGDGLHTFNISTTVAFVVAGCGVRVAKHGNRAMSSTTGSADVLEVLGVRIAASAEDAVRCLDEAGICFLFAPAFHPAMRFVSAVRKELRMRTVFNLLGPLANPAPANAQIVGAPSVDAAARIAAALGALGLRRGYTVCGEDGLDEVTLTGATHAFEIRDGETRPLALTPEDFRLARCAPDDLRGGLPAENAAITDAILMGLHGPKRDIVLANAGLALIACGVANNYLDGVARSAASIDSGAAVGRLQALVKASHRAH